MSKISAEIISNNTIKVNLSKSFYEGISTLFKLRNTEGLSKLLTIVSKKENKNDIEYLLKTDELNIGEEYIVADQHNLTCSLSYENYVKTEEFRNTYYYDGDDLGPVYTKEKTTFKVYAPTASKVMLNLERQGYVVALEMTRGLFGVYEIEVPGDLELATYTYLVKVNGQWNEATDPYAYSSTPNHQRSVVINPHRCVVNMHKDKLDEFKNNVDAVIYELHVRDFSVSETSGMKNKGKFLAFMEPNPEYKGYKTGLSRIKDLGVTHIQLMPIYDFGSVDELNQFDYYNWGYDPVQYNVPEGSYASDVRNPYSRVIECMEMIASIHKSGMRCNMDVVYNHMFSMEQSAFEKLVPHYYFRYGKNGKVSNGSFCGNDIDSLMPMAHKFIVDSCKRWASFYGVDGFRFDLMGIIDYKTINEIYEECKKINPDFMVYGEGWNMPSLYAKNLKAIQLNNHKMPNIGHFNDRIRDIVKGDTDTARITNKGYATGDYQGIEIVKDSILGTSKKVDYGYNYLSPNQVVNYVECHDNYTLWDKLLLCNPDETMEEHIARHKLITSIIILSQGIPFIHAGQEFCRTKDCDHNSYISSDEINKLDYQRMIDFDEVVKYVKDLLAIRSKYPTFRLTNQKDIEKYTKISNDNAVIIYELIADNLVIVFNPMKETYNCSTEMNKIFGVEGATNLVTSIVEGLSTAIFIRK